MNQEKIVEEGHEDQDNDEIFDEDGQPPKDIIVPQPAKTAKSDIYAWRKRQSIAFHRNPLRLRRRMSQGK
jgi:hypothetical protein